VLGVPTRCGARNAIPRGAINENDKRQVVRFALDNAALRHLNRFNWRRAAAIVHAQER
jgi:hypothetical protein